MQRFCTAGSDALGRLLSCERKPTLGGTDPFDRRSRGLGGPGALGAVGHRVAGCGLEAVSRLARPLRAQPGRPGWFPADGGHRAAVARARDHVPTTQWVQIAVPGYVAAQIVAAVEYFALVRAAELTVPNGRDYFRVLGGDADVRTINVLIPGQTFHWVLYRGGGSQFDPLAELPFYADRVDYFDNGIVFIAQDIQNTQAVGHCGDTGLMERLRLRLLTKNRTCSARHSG